MISGPEAASATAPPHASPSWTQALARELSDLGESPVTDPEILESFSRDRAPLAPAGTPIALVRARSIEHVVRTLRFANERRIPVVTRAAGSGLAGGANAVDGCIVLSVAPMDRILGIDVPSRLATVEPGVINAALAAEAAARGLYYAPDPSSRDISTIGGNIATNAGGACCLKYGVTGDHVAALKVVLADGSVIRTGALTRKNVAGLDLTRLMVGSEGTLGVIVEATVRLLPATRPPHTLVAFFEQLDQAGEAIVSMDAAGAPSLLEVMDKVTVGAVEELARMDLDTSAAAMVLLQSDAPDAPNAIAACEAICARIGARSVLVTEDPEEGRMLLQARRMAMPALERKGTTLLDDVCVPKLAVPEMIRRIARIAARRDVVVASFGHAGDGNLHPTIVFDGREPRSEAKARAAFDDILSEAIALGGSLTGEHGVGSLKPPYMGSMIGPAERALMHRIKASFDPHGILNPGKAF